MRLLASICRIDCRLAIDLTIKSIPQHLMRKLGPNVFELGGACNTTHSDPSFHAVTIGLFGVQFGALGFQHV